MHWIVLYGRHQTSLGQISFFKLSLASAAVAVATGTISDKRLWQMTSRWRHFTWYNISCRRTETTMSDVIVTNPINHWWMTINCYRQSNCWSVGRILYRTAIEPTVIQYARHARAAWLAAKFLATKSHQRYHIGYSSKIRFSSTNDVI